MTIRSTRRFTASSSQDYAVGLFTAALVSAFILLAGLASAQEAKIEPETSIDIDSLRALPYAGFSSKPAGPRRGLVTLDRDLSSPGYTLVSYSALCRAELLDGRGKTVRAWQQDPSMACHHWSHAELLPDGDLLVPVQEPGQWRARPPGSPPPRHLLRLDFDGNLVWRRPLAVHHDVELTPRQQLMTLTLSRRWIAEVSTTIEVKDNALTLLSPEGRFLDELSLYDLFTLEPDCFPLLPTGAGDPKKVRPLDLFHANSVEWVNRPYLEGRHPIYDPGHVLVSLRNQNTILVIDWDERRIEWMWGRGELRGPHDATVLDNGNILIFDNGLGRNWSRIVELDPISETIVWEYRAEDLEAFYSPARGSSQRLPGGTTLIANSDSGAVFEVTADGKVVYEYLTPHLNPRGQRATIVRAKRYDRAVIEPLLR